MRRLALMVLLAGLVLASTGCPDIDDENTPIAVVDAPGPQDGAEVTLTYRLRNRSTNRVDVTIDWGPASPRPVATRGSGGEGTDNLTATPGGAVHTFVWDALTDVGPGFHDAVDLRVIPFLGGDRGSADRTPRFTLDATDLFRPVSATDPDGPRQAPAVAILPDSSVLVAGGADPAGVPLAGVVRWNPADDSITALTPMGTARQGAVAATFPDGRVLVAGGTGAGGILDTTEVYDPRTDSWSAGPLLNSPAAGHRAVRLAGGDIAVLGGTDGTSARADLDRFAPGPPVTVATHTMGTARERPAAVLLEDSTVLIAGGLDGTGSPIGSAETYDPATNGFAATGTLQVPRGAAAATRLADGDVLLAGGEASGGPTGAIETWDPGTGAFTRLNDGSGDIDLATPRRGAAAWPLPDGRAVVAGGVGGGVGLASAERIDPTAATVEPTLEPMSVARAAPADRVLTSGRVLLAGDDGLDEYVTPHVAGVEVFDAVADTPAPRVGAVTVRLAGSFSGHVLIAGGRDDPQGDPRSDAEVFDPEDRLGAGSFVPTGQDMGTPRRDAAGARLADGRVIVAGGRTTGGTVVDSAEIYDPGADSWSPAGDVMGTTRADHAAVRLDDDRILFAGGVDDGGTPLASLEVWDPSTGSFVTLGASLGTARSGLTATVLEDDRVLLAGGRDGAGTALDAAAIFDPATDGVTSFTLDVPRAGHGAALRSSGEVILCGGEDAAGVPVASTTLVDPAGPSAAGGPSMTTPRLAPAVAPFEEGDAILAVGGEDDLGALRSDAEVLRTAFNPPAGSPPAVPRRAAASAVVLPDGRVLVVGGRTTDDLPVAGADLFSP